MPDIAKSIRTLVVADSTVSALISSRMYPGVLPQKATLPACVHYIIDTDANETLSAIADLTMSTVRIESIAETQSESTSLADAVRLALEKYRGLSGSQYIKEISLASGERHEIIEPAAGSDRRRYLTEQDFDVYFQTTTS